MSEPTAQAENGSGGVRWVVVLPLAGFVVLAGLFLWGLMFGNPRYIPSVLVGKPAPAFDLPALPGATGPDGKPLPGLSLAGLKRTPGIKMVNFFASWCVSCRQEHPFLVELARRGEIPIYGIAYKDAPEKTLAWLSDLGNPYARIGVDRSGRTGIDFGVYGIPETFFIDERGVIVYKYTGPLSPEAWEKDVKPALKKALAERKAQPAG
jgi:cytochrome c biogenesis protein CcmG/thiol:disulfide interchange protein DsbE